MECEIWTMAVIRSICMMWHYGCSEVNVHFPLTLRLAPLSSSAILFESAIDGRDCLAPHSILNIS